MDQPARKPPRRRDDRVVLQFDYDCFYAQVWENRKPALRSRPLGVRQKNILATCNYHARSRGVAKLMLVSEACSICPDLVLVDGEDLTPFRDVSKLLFNFLRSHSWNDRVERLGFDEVFMDVTDIVDYNMSCLNRASMADSFFHLSQRDPELGFGCDLTSVAGCVVGPPVPGTQVEHPTYLRLLLASHLAQYLRLKLETEFGYTSTCGIATNKLLSKLAGSCNKPRNQTTLLALEEEDVIGFIDGYKTRKIPGLGFKTAMALESHVLGQPMPLDGDAHSLDTSVTVGQVRQHPSISPASLESLVGGSGAERGVGSRVWGLLHGVDPSEVKEASDIPSQIGIEDTYRGLETMAQIMEELHKLSCSLVRRMRVDLVVPDGNADTPGSQKWVARPKTLRLSVRPWPTRQGHGQSQSPSWGRVSRSGPLPSFVFDLKADIDSIAHQLVAEALLPLLRRVQSDKGQRWKLQMLNVCVANMVAGAGDDKTGAGRDIAAMFKKQDEVLRAWRVTEGSGDERDGGGAGETVFEEPEPELERAWDEPGHRRCPRCGRCMPLFAMAAHARYHELDE